MFVRVSRSGQSPEPTVIVRMKEIVYYHSPHARWVRVRVRSDSFTRNGEFMNQFTTHTSTLNVVSQTQRVAIVSSSWHRAIVDNAVSAIQACFDEQAHAHTLTFHELPGAFELPLFIKKLLKTGEYDAVIACGLVVNGGIYRHDFVASAVIDGLMQVQLDFEVPVFSVVLTPHDFHEHAEHIDFYSQHFIKKGREAAEACLQTLAAHQALEAVSAG